MMNFRLLTFPAQCIAWVVLGFCLGACEDSFEVFAPEKDIWVVYGVLDADQDTQRLRIGKVFQIEADAIEFARTFDPSEKGLTVSVRGNGQSYLAVGRDSVVKDTSQGAFGPYTFLYEFETAGEKALLPGETYTLEIRSEQDTSLFLTAYTRLPEPPRILTPNILRSNGGDRCLRAVPFEDSVFVQFRTFNSGTYSSAFRYEIRVEMNFSKNGEPQTHHYGPTRLFNQSRGCNNAVDGICYLLRNGEVIRGLRTAFRDSTATYTYEPEPRCGGLFTDLSHAVELQITAIDTFLGKHILANDPFFRDLNTVRKEWTNVEGSDQAVGVFGSISYENVPVSLTPCGEYLLGLRATRPGATCEL